MAAISKQPGTPLRLSDKKGYGVLGKFDTNNTSAPDGIEGDLLSVTRTGVGAFTVLLKANVRVPHLAATLSSKQVLMPWAQVVGTAGTVPHIKTITNSAGMVTGFTLELRRPAAAGAAAAWTTGIVVTADVAAAQAAGWVTNVQATAAGSVGVKGIMQGGAPAAGQVRVEYTAGVPAITFAAADAVTAAAIQRIVPAAVASAATDTNDELVYVGLIARDTKQARL